MTQSDGEATKQQTGRLPEPVEESQLLADLGVLAGPMTHEFNNFVNVVLLQAAILETDMLDSHRDELARLRQHGKTIAALIQEWHRYRGRLPVVLQPLDLHQAIDRALAAQPPESAVRIRLGLAEAIPPVLVVAGDTDRLLRFLLSNALAVGPCVTLRTSAQGDHVHLRVEDDGPAVPAERLAHVFEPAPLARGRSLWSWPPVSRSSAAAGKAGSGPRTGAKADWRSWCRCRARPTSRPPRRRSERMSGTATVATGEPQRRILLVEDDETTCRHLQSLLQQTTPYEIDAVRNGEEALSKLAQPPARPAGPARPYDLLLTDLRLPGVDGMDLLRAVHDQKLPVQVIVITGLGGVEEAVKALRLGACDFLTKPIDLDNLRLVLQRCLHKLALHEEVKQLRGRMRTTPSYHDILSRNPRMHAIFELIGQIAPTSTTVLIEGETGTGKERLAAAIHRASRRCGHIVAVNASAVPETLLESELFGHEKGSFTGAIGQRKGRFELAHQGTLFLDEIGDVPASMQARLLRVLQERSFERVGGTETIQVDVRVVAATNRSLQQLVRKGTFREDLFYRINVVKIDLPPLRDRLEDIPLLANHFAALYARPDEPLKRFSQCATDLLLSYSWPGNVRELENVVQRACLTARGEVIEPENLSRELNNPTLEKRALSVDLSKPLPELIREAVATVEAQYLRKALKKVRGHVGKCARLCGCSRRSITAKLAEYGIDRHEFQ